MRLELTVRRFRCANGQCIQSTFVERFPSWLPAYARRTTRLTEVVRQIGFEVGGESRARILKYLQIIASGDTVLRVVRQTASTVSDELRVIGVDDWAIKKGRSYGTIIVNLETHRVVDLLLDRTGETVAQWLQDHPGVEIITRDRSTEYANGIREGRPQALQVADRWHLLLNVRQITERFLGTIHAQLRTLPMSDECAQALKQQRPAFRRTRTAQALSEASRDQRVAYCEQVQQWRREGYDISQIARKLDWKWETARNCFYAPQFPERKQQRSRRSILDPYLSYLEHRYAEGCENASQLWREIKALGYPGTNKQVLRWMQLRRAQPAPTTPGPYRETCIQPPASSQSIVPSTRRLAWLMVKDPEQLTETERLTLAHIQQEVSGAKVYLLTQQFVVMIKQRQVEHLDPWLDACATSGIAQAQSFAVGIQQDYAAIHAALGTAWSNGPVEGQVNRLKFIKRQMYGRANFDLLRRRVLWPP